MLLIVRGYIPNNYDRAKTEIVLGILEYIVTFPSHTINYKVLLLPKYLLSLLFLSPLLSGRFLRADCLRREPWEDLST